MVCQFADGADVYPLHDEIADEEVPKVVKGKSGDASFFTGGSPCGVHVSDVAGAGWRGEEVALFAVVLSDGGDLGQYGFRYGGEEVLFVFNVGCRDGDSAVCGVDPVVLQAEYVGGTQAGCGGDLNGKGQFRGGVVNECVDLFFLQGTHFVVVFGQKTGFLNILPGKVQLGGFGCRYF